MVMVLICVAAYIRICVAVCPLSAHCCCRDDPSTAHLAVKAAGPLKLQLSRMLAANSQQQLLEGEFAAAQQQHNRALALAKEAAQEMQQVGAVLLQLQAAQQIVEFMLQSPERMLLQEQHNKQLMEQQQQQQTVTVTHQDTVVSALLPLDESPLLLEARGVLQVRWW